MLSKLKKISITIVVFLLMIIAALYFSTYHPSDLEKQDVYCKNNAENLKIGQKIKVLNWNIQFMAGKKYVFFFDRPKGDGSDIRPETEEIQRTIKEVARVIKDENPDFILLQEVDDGAKRTDSINELDELYKILPEEYKCHSSAFYWKSKFVPHPKIMGSVGMKVSTISKYKINSATRHALALIPADPISTQLGLKRAILQVNVPVENSKDLIVMNTHLDAFAQGSNTMEMQVSYIDKVLKEFDKEGMHWFIGGDFNLLPPGVPLESIIESHRIFYNYPSEIEVLFKTHSSVFTKEEMSGPEKEKLYSHLPNDPDIKNPDRILDYIFYSKNLNKGNYYIRSEDTLGISDHLPMIAEFYVKE